MKAFHKQSSICQLSFVFSTKRTTPLSIIKVSTTLTRRERIKQILHALFVPAFSVEPYTATILPKIETCCSEFFYNGPVAYHRICTTTCAMYDTCDVYHMSANLPMRYVHLWVSMSAFAMLNVSNENLRQGKEACGHCCWTSQACPFTSQSALLHWTPLALSGCTSDEVIIHADRMHAHPLHL